MTPLARFLAAHLPRPLAWLALVLAYGGVLLAVLMVPTYSPFDAVYIDVQGD